MTKRLRAVFDTNVFVSAFLSRNPSSPTQELIQRWKSGEFDLLVSDALIDELAEKLQHKGVSASARPNASATTNSTACSIGVSSPS